MISRCPSFLLIVCLAWIGTLPKQAVSFAGESATQTLLTAQPPKAIPQLAQADRGSQSALAIGAQGPQVAELQKTLKLLGYFEGEVTGVYESSTAEAVGKFQKATSLPGATGAQNASANAKDGKHGQPNSQQWLRWLLGLAGGSVLLGGLGWFARRRRSPETTDEPRSESPNEAFAPSQDRNPLPLENGKGAISDSAPTEGNANFNGHNQTMTVAETLPHKEQTESTMSHIAETPKVSETTRLAKINIVDELIRDLRIPDPVKRHKVIWELGQRGDTRAVQPMVDLMIDSDSKQRSLILSALSEIGTRTLKPLSRALAISLQDENAEVRKNAIRDLTRVYDMVAQISHLLHKAADDPDRDVQETARWALGQLNRIRSVPGMEMPALKNSVSPPESLP